jgi:hypothetical protein
MKRDAQELTEYLNANVRRSGDKIFIILPNSDLEEVGEDCLIATHGTIDRKKVGRAVLQKIISYLYARARFENVYSGLKPIELIDTAVDSAMQKVGERMQRIDEQTKTLGLTFEEAQYWEALTGNMNYEQKMAYIKAAQDEAQCHGRKLNLPKAMQQEKAKK